jgi:hypothetical protein
MKNKASNRKELIFDLKHKNGSEWSPDPCLLIQEMKQILIFDVTTYKQNFYTNLKQLQVYIPATVIFARSGQILSGIDNTFQG